MPDPVQPNSPEARSPTGEIIDSLTPPANPPADPPKDSPADPSKDASLLNKGKEPAAGAPEKYDFKVPEGFTLDEAVSKEAGDLFKSLGLNQEGAQKLLDMYIARTREAAEAPFKAYQDMRTEWQAAVKADPEIGSKLADVKATVSRALDSLGDPKLAQDFREAMDLTGAGDNPAFIKAFYKMAQKLSEGTSVRGSGPSRFGQATTGRPESAAKALYPNLP